MNHTLCRDLFQLGGETYQCAWWAEAGMSGAQALDRHVQEGRHYSSRLIGGEDYVNNAIPYRVEWYRNDT